jgi:hypothetical protein
MRPLRQTQQFYQRKTIARVNWLTRRSFDLGGSVRRRGSPRTSGGKAGDDVVDSEPQIFHCHRRLLAILAPSASAWNFAHTMLACTSFEPAKVAKPQSAPAMTFSRPTTAA